MFEKLLYEQLNNNYTFLKLFSATYNRSKKSLKIVLLYPNGYVLSDDDKNNIKSACIEIVKPYCNDIKISLKKIFADLGVLSSDIKDMIIKDFPLLSIFLEKGFSLSCDDDKVIVSVLVEQNLKEYIDRKNFKKALENYLKLKYQIESMVQVAYIDKFEFESDKTDNIVIDDYDPFADRFIKVYDRQKFIGESFEDKPLYITDVKFEAETICVSGKINNFSIKSYKNSAGKERYIAKFQLIDPTGAIDCVFFVSESNLAKIKKLDNEIEIVVLGQSRLGKFTNDFEVLVKNIMLCQMEKNFVEKINFKKEPANYKVVIPEKFEHAEQLSLFSHGHKYNEYVNNHDLVVFDIETTGLNYIDSEIIEIGAIKVKRGGVIAEKFSTFVKPSGKIPKEITQLTGIKDEDVENATTLNDAIADFYKFTRNSTLIGHNISFDYGFINYYGRKVGYDFSHNEKQDTYVISSNAIKGLKNYKLKTIAEYFGIDLKNAHRAYFDAYATAQIYLKLSEIV